MTATVRVFFFDSIVAAPTVGKSYTTDSVGLLKYPYLARDNVTVDSGTADSVSAAPAGARIALVQVQSGKTVHAEVNPPNRSTTADTASPVWRGDLTIAVGPDWTISFLEAS